MFPTIAMQCIVSTFVLVDCCLVIDGEFGVRVDADTDISDVSVNLPRLVSEKWHHNYYLVLDTVTEKHVTR